MKKKDTAQFNSGWSFAIVNGKLAEIHFKKGLGIWAHAYVKREEYKTKREQKMIDQDIKTQVFSYRKGYYYDKIRKVKIKIPSIKKIFPDLKSKKYKTLKF